MSIKNIHVEGKLRWYLLVHIKRNLELPPETNCTEKIVLCIHLMT